MTRSGLLAMIMTIALGVVQVPAATAQQSTAPSMEPAAQIDENELRSFAVAVVEVQRVSNTYQPIFEAAGTTEEQQKVVKTAQTEVQQVIQKQGLSMDRFNQILAHTQANDELADRVRQYIKEAK